jgi:hypothetical protein
MIKNYDDIQKLSQANMETSMKAFGELTKNWQSLAAEFANYSKRSFEDGTQTFEKLLAVKSVDQAVELQTSYAKRQYDEYMQQMTKITGMYTDLAKEAYKPVERAIQQTR